MIQFFVSATEQLPEQVKLTVDGLAVAGWMTALFGVLTGLFALLAAVLSFAWGAVRLYETKTVQGWLSRRRCK